jgi:hypothetical protein
MEEHYKKNFSVDIQTGVWASRKDGTDHKEKQTVGNDVKHRACRPYPKHKAAD